MNSIITILFIALVLFQGCAVTHEVIDDNASPSGNEISQQEFEETIVGKFAILNLLSGKQHSGKILDIQNHKIQCDEFQETLLVSIRDLKSVAITSDKMSPVITVPLFGIFGGLIGSAAVQGVSGRESSSLWNNLNGFSYGMIAGAIGGLAFANAEPTTITYVFRSIPNNTVYGQAP
jgi:hypothetical protein